MKKRSSFLLVVIFLIITGAGSQLEAIESEGNRAFLEKLKYQVDEFLTSQIKEKFDSSSGGYNNPPKTSEPLINEYLIHRYWETKDKKYLNWALKTLDNISSSQNAQLLTNYLEAYLTTKKEKYLDIAQKIIKFSLNNPPLNKVDKPVSISYNAQAVRSFFLAYLVFEEERYLKIAEKNLSFLIKLERDRKKQFKLEERLSLLEAILTAYEYTGDSQYLEEINQMAEAISKQDIDLAASSRLAKIFLQYAGYQMENSETFYKKADKLLLDWADKYQKYGIDAVVYAEALSWDKPFIVRAVVVGEEEKKETRLLAQTFQRTYLYPRLTLILDPQRYKGKLACWGYDISLRPTIYICLADYCFFPLCEPNALPSALEKILPPKGTNE